MLYKDEHLRKIARVARIIPQYEGEDVESATQSYLQDLMHRYPFLQWRNDYCNILRYTGGAHIHNQQFSLCIYGFPGIQVPSFDEAEFLDEGGFFIFANVQYQKDVDEIIYFAFSQDPSFPEIYCTEEDVADYRVCSSSLSELFDQLIQGQEPGLPSEQHA